MFKFICPRCGSEGQVPFQPSNPDRILCSKCHEETGGKTFDLSRSHKAPRKRHNTRVVINIVCAECHKPAVLDYAPKGVAIEDMKCEECLAKDYGSGSRWAMIRDLKTREHDYVPRSTFTVKCSACHQETELPFRPQNDVQYFCKSCYDNDGIPVGPTHREGHKETLKPNLFVRRRRRSKDRGPDSLAATDDLPPVVPSKHRISDETE